jgi:hypothetical protein
MEYPRKAETFGDMRIVNDQKPPMAGRLPIVRSEVNALFGRCTKMPEHGKGTWFLEVGFEWMCRDTSTFADI